MVQVTYHLQYHFDNILGNVKSYDHLIGLPNDTNATIHLDLLFLHWLSVNKVS